MLETPYIPINDTLIKSCTFPFVTIVRRTRSEVCTYIHAQEDGSKYTTERSFTLPGWHG